MEFLGGIADSSTKACIVRLSPGPFTRGATKRHHRDRRTGTSPFNEIVARYLKAIGDPRTVVRDPDARYFGSRVEKRSLVPLGEGRLGRIGLDEWVRRSQASA